MLRRLKNTSRELPAHHTEEIILKYMQELREGGYPIEIREEILNSAFRGYTKMWRAEVAGTG